LPIPSSTAVTFRDDIIARQKRKGSSTSHSSGESSGASLVRRRPGNGRKSTKIHEPSERQGRSITEQEVDAVLEHSQPRASDRSTKAMVRITSFWLQTGISKQLPCGPSADTEPHSTFPSHRMHPLPSNISEFVHTWKLLVVGIKKTMAFSPQVSYTD
jgi:hypothetical protein